MNTVFIGGAACRGESVIACSGETKTQCIQDQEDGGPACTQKGDKYSRVKVRNDNKGLRLYLSTTPEDTAVDSPASSCIYRTCRYNPREETHISPIRTQNLQASPRRGRVHVLHAFSAPTTAKKSAIVSSDPRPASMIRNDAQHTGSGAEANLTFVASSSSLLGTVGI
jgi:hypothetical protein